MKNILVPGGAGFIGCNFVRHLLEAHPAYHVTVYDKLTYAGRLENLQDMAERFAGRYRFIQGDICDAVKVRGRWTAPPSTPSSTSPWKPMWTAASSTRMRSFRPACTARTCCWKPRGSFGNLRYHQISTDEVYGHIEGDHRSVETDCLAPRSPYAASKASADHLVHAYAITYGLPVTITRGANNIGPYQYPEKVVPLFVTNALGDHPLPVYGDGQQMRDYQYVRDHCAAVDLVLHRGAVGEVYNVGTGQEMTNLAMVEILLDELGSPLPDPTRGRPQGTRPALCVERGQDPAAWLGAGLHL